MTKFILGVVVGIVLSTVGVRGVTTMFQKSISVVDNNINTIKSITKEASK